MKRIIVICFLLLLGFAVAQACWQFSHLPARVASRFDFAGRPVGWMSRATLFGWQLFGVLLVAGVLEGLARLHRFMPEGNINLPHRDYWLSPERRPATLDWLETMVRCSACGVLLLFIVLFHQVYRANTTPGDRTFATGLTLCAVLVGLASLVIACWVRFGRRPS